MRKQVLFWARVGVLTALPKALFHGCKTQAFQNLEPWAREEDGSKILPGFSGNNLLVTKSFFFFNYWSTFFYLNCAKYIWNQIVYGPYQKLPSVYIFLRSFWPKTLEIWVRPFGRYCHCNFRVCQNFLRLDIWGFSKSRGILQKYTRAFHITLIKCCTGFSYATFDA